MNRCPRCSKELKCLGGESAHPNNWYCPDEKECGYAAWLPIAAKTNPSVGTPGHIDCAPPLKLYLLTVDDRHQDLECYIFSDPDVAIAEARKLVRARCKHPDDHQEFADGDEPLFLGRYAFEDGTVAVNELVLNERPA